MKIFFLTLLFIFGTFLDPLQYSASGNETPHHFVIDYMSKRIKLWVDDRTGDVTEATFLGSFDPREERDFPIRRNFLIRIAEEEGFRFVAFIDDHEKLLGVRSPIIKDDTPTPDPTDSIWHIFYDGRGFELRVNPVTELEEAISLVPRNLRRNRTIPKRVFVGGIEFYIFRDQKRRIVSARLPPR